jgi:hypothetical protein
MADSAAPAPLAVTGGRGTTEDDAMTENKRWWQAYLAALTGMHAYGQAGESYSIEGADRAAAQAADMALTRWRAIGAQAESSGETSAALPAMCAGCVHAAKSAAEEPCASCVSGSGRGADRDAADAYARAAMAESLDATRAIAAQRDVALTERDTARRELGEVREVLAKVEWSGYQEEGHSECPCCYARARNGHRADCALAAALKGSDHG